MEIKDLPQSIQTLVAEAKGECPVCGIMIAKYQYNKNIVYGTICGGISESRGVWCDCIMVYYDQDEYEEEIYKDINAGKILIKEVYRCTE